MAIIAHGFSRPTKDSDVWLEPFGSAEEWASRLREVMNTFRGLQVWSLSRRCVLPPEDIAAEAEDFGVVRVNGLSLPLDVFRKPNELEVGSFEDIWSNSRALKDGVHLPDEIDLYRTKINTGRDQDWKDQLFLESLVKKRFRERLPVCGAAEARGLFERFLDPEVLAFALDNPDAEVRALALVHLREFETEGDPYSRDILAAWRTKNPVA
ncbi:MAG: hypothetical protein ABMA13_17630 [Chthoniobacteraceae bacterium]